MGHAGFDDYFTRDFANNIGAEIMGRNKFGPHRGPWEDLEWQGWWGDDPPFRTPVFVLTHYPRPSFTLSDTTFHFIDATPAEALAQAKEAADGKDVRIGGGVETVREFLDADLIDTMHVAVAPIELGRGERLWESPDELLDRFHLETVPSPSGVTHLHLLAALNESFARSVDVRADEAEDRRHRDHQADDPLELADEAVACLALEASDLAAHF